MSWDSKPNQHIEIIFVHLSNHTSMLFKCEKNLSIMVLEFWLPGLIHLFSPGGLCSLRWMWLVATSLVQRSMGWYMLLVDLVQMVIIYRASKFMTQNRINGHWLRAYEGQGGVALGAAWKENFMSWVAVQASQSAILALLTCMILITMCGVRSGMDVWWSQLMLFLVKSSCASSGRTRGA